MNLIRTLAGIAITILGFYAGWTVIHGISSGDIMQFSKHGNAIFHKTIEPDRFWIAIGFWSIGAIMLIFGGLNIVRKNL